ncbi:MAG: hypothetical protein WAM14_10260, partial [Candidatus Nitrosopolaris sp.]
NHRFSDKMTIWRTYYIKTSENTEQRIIIQMYSIQHPQTDQSYNIPWFLLSRLGLQSRRNGISPPFYWRVLHTRKHNM